VSAAREEILARIRAANAGRASVDVDAAYAALPRDYVTAHHDPEATDIVALFAERAADYRAVVERVTPGQVPAAIGRALAEWLPASAPNGVGAPATPLEGAAAPATPLAAAPRFVVAEGLPPEWLAEAPGAVELVHDESLSTAELDRLAGAITGCAVAVAETGTIILDHGSGQGRRALTLVPDFHLVIVRAAQIVPDLPGAFAALTPERPHTLISGPSATSDIELIRVEGVHGPRNLHVLIVA
jgi:L-lactate dehydrogenase complex protein LldG